MDGVSLFAFIAHLSFLTSVTYNGLQCKYWISTCRPFMGNLMIRSSMESSVTETIGLPSIVLMHPSMRSVAAVSSMSIEVIFDKSFTLSDSPVVVWYYVFHWLSLESFYKKLINN